MKSDFFNLRCDESSPDVYLSFCKHSVPPLILCILQRMLIGLTTIKCNYAVRRYVCHALTLTYL